MDKHPSSPANSFDAADMRFQSRSKRSVAIDFSKHRKSKALLLACAALGLGPLPLAEASWIPTTSGTYSATTNTNWDGNSINWLFDRNLGGNQVLTLGSDVTLGTNLLNFRYTTAGDITLQSDTGTPRTIFMGASGQSPFFRVSSSDIARTITIGTDDNPIALNLGGTGANSNRLILDVGKNGTLVMNTVISGTSKPLFKSGEGTLVLTRPNALVSGTTQLNEGRLVLDFSTAQSGTSNILSGVLALRSGVFEVKGRSDGTRVAQSFTSASLTGAFGALPANGHVDIFLNSNGGTGGVSLNLGTFARQQGTLNFQFDESNSEISVDLGISGGASAPSIYNGILTGHGNSRRGAAFATFNGDTWATGSLVTGGTFGSAGTYKITGYTAYTTTLSATSNVSYSGTTVSISTANPNINTLRLQDGASIALSSTLTLQSGGILITGTTENAGSIIGGKMTVPGAVTNSELVVFQNNTRSSFTIDSDISGVLLTKAGAGTLILGNTYARTSGTTQITEGIVQVSSMEPIKSSEGTGTLMLAGGFLKYVGAGESSGVVVRSSMGGGIDSSGTGALVLTDTTTKAATYVNSLHQTTSFTLKGSNKDDNYFYGFLGNVDPSNQGAEAFIKEGEGTWVLGNSTSTYRLATQILGGTLKVVKLANSGVASSIGFGNFGPVASDNLLIDGGRLEYIGGGDSTNRQFTIGTKGGALAASGSGAVVFSATNAVAYGMANEARSVKLAGTNTGDNTLAALITDNGTGKTSLVKDEAGTWVLTNTNSFTGGTVVNDGKLVLQGGNNRLALTGAITVNSGATLDLGGYQQNASSVLLAGGLIQSGTLTVNQGSGVLEVRSGTLDARGSSTLLKKTTSGTATLTKSRTWTNAQIDEGTFVIASGVTANSTGATTIGAGGEMILNGILGNSTVLAGRLSGNGYLGSVTVQAGGVLAPGNSIGILTADETILEGGYYELELGTDGTGTAGVDWDQYFSSTLDMSALSEVNQFTLKLITLTGTGTGGALDEWDGGSDHIWNSVFLTDDFDLGSGFNASHFKFDTTGFANEFHGSFSLALNQDGNGLDLVYAVPEPGTYMMFLGGAGALWMLGRGRGRRAAMAALGRS